MNGEERRGNQAIDDLIGLYVSIRSRASQTEYKDNGTLEAYDYPWVRLRKSETEVLCFSVENIRLIEPLDPVPVRKRGPSEVLLRAAPSAETEG